MCRYTALRTTLILSAVLRPLLTLAIFVCLAADWISLWVVAFGVCLMLVAIAPTLCLDPALEESRPRPLPEGTGSRRAALIWLVYGLPFFYLPGVQDFVLKCITRLWDWRAITGASILCFLWLQRELRAALAFKPSDLYPNLKRD